MPKQSQARTVRIVLLNDSDFWASGASIVELTEDDYELLYNHDVDIETLQDEDRLTHITDVL